MRRAGSDETFLLSLLDIPRGSFQKLPDPVYQCNESIDRGLVLDAKIADRCSNDRNGSQKCRSEKEGRRPEEKGLVKEKRNDTATEISPLSQRRALLLPNRSERKPQINPPTRHIQPKMDQINPANFCGNWTSSTVKATK